MPTGRTRGWWAVVATLGLALLLAGTPAAQADEDALTVSVSVYDDESGEPVQGASVALHGTDPADGKAAFQTTSTNADGIATFEGVAPGTYWSVVSKAGFTKYTSEGWPVDASNPYLDAVYLQPLHGTVSGTILDEDQKGYNCAEVRAYPTGQDPSGDLESINSDGTNTDGAYSMDLRVGTYKLEVVDYCGDYPSAWIGTAGATYQTATTVTVVEKGTSVGQFQLRIGSQVTGTVKGADGAVVEDVRVVAVPAGQDPEDGESVALSRSDAKGVYKLRRLAPGTYDVRFTDPLGDFQPTVLENVVVGSADVTGKNVTLTKVPASVDTNLLKGKITGASGSGIGGLSIKVVGDVNVYDAVTRRDGSWSVPVESGSYKIEFSDEQGDADGNPRYVSEWFDDAPTYTTAKTVKIDTKAVTVNARLAKLGTISGTISTPGTWDERYFSVELYDADGDRVGGTDTDSAGRYELTNVVPGTYRLRMAGYVSSEAEGGQQLVRQFYAGKFSLATATDVVVGDGQAVTKRNVTLTSRITNVSVPKVSGTAAKAKTLTASSGSWSLVVDVQHAYQWYRGSTKISGATKSTYKAASGDVGKQLKVCVVARHRYDRYDPSAAACSGLTKRVAAK